MLFLRTPSRRIKDVAFAIESSCDDTCFSIFKTDNTLIHAFKYSQKKLHQPFGGVVPQLASQGHRNSFQKIQEKKIVREYLRSKLIKFIAVTAGPGIGSCLATGYDVARQMARSNNIPLVPINHLVMKLCVILLILITCLVGSFSEC